MALNDKYFVPPELTRTLLRARGFLDTGERSGGIVAPTIVELPSGTILFRMYHEVKRKYGEWWATPHELAVIADYFGRNGRAFDEGRRSGDGILHATFVVRHDWGNNDRMHLGKFLVVQLAETFKAFHGEGDHAPNASHTQVQKAAPVFDTTGQQRRARQIMLPRAWEYEASMTLIAGGYSRQSLFTAITRHRGQRLAFE